MFGELKFAKIVPGEVNGLGLEETLGVVQRIRLLGNDRFLYRNSPFSSVSLITAGVFSSYSTAVRDLVVPPKRVIL